MNLYFVDDDEMVTTMKWKLVALDRKNRCFFINLKRKYTVDAAI